MFKVGSRWRVENDKLQSIHSVNFEKEYETIRGVHGEKSGHGN